MRFISTFFLICTLKGFSQQTETLRKRYDFSQHVNVMVGTDAHGHTHPSACAPFGMMQLGPDTRYMGWDGCSGYHYSDSVIYGFSHTHLSGTGVEDLNDLLIVPQENKVLIEPGYKVKGGYGASFSHKKEKAEPGYYEVELNNGIKCQLAVTERAGLHQYTFTSTKDKFILIDLDHRDQLLDSDLKIIGKNVVTGSRRSRSWAQNQHFYFYLESKVNFKKAKLITKGGKHKLLLTFDKSVKEVSLKVGISAVDVDGAKLNLNKELTTWDIVQIKNQTRASWNEELNKLHYFSNDKTSMDLFYTSMYHAYLCPTVFSDVDGRFRGNDGNVHQSNTHQQYAIFSLWDTYRTAHPLYTLTQAKKTEDFISSFLAIYKQIGTLPVWELNGNETNCMIGYHSVSVITDAYNKGIINFDTKLALEAMVATAKKDELGKSFYANNGFIASNAEPESVSKTLEYAYDDWCIANFAKALKNNELEKEFMQRSYNFINVFDPQTKFMRPRIGGIWRSPFVPSEVNFNYTEANSYQYSMAAPQHIGTLRYMLGGKDSLEAWLDRLFTADNKLEGRQQADITGLIGQYAHGNEPSHHIAYLYNYTNHPYKTQEKIDQIMREMYQNTPEGLSGNEDCGQMSAWYAMSSIGLYPVCPGNPTYTFGRPTQEYANFHFENGKSFYVRTENNSKKNKYIQKITLNGHPYYKLYITHEELLKGGELIFYMGEQANNDLKNYESDLKETDAFPDKIVPKAYFTATSSLFKDSIKTEIKTLADKRFQIRYTTDGTEPNIKSKLYSTPLVFHSNTTLKAKVFARNEGDKKMPYLYDSTFAVSTNFVKMRGDVHLKVLSEYNNQYNGGNPEAMIDQIFGGKDFRTGPWQGYFGNNAEGEISFDAPKNLAQITISCLQDVRSWIFMPTSLEIEISTDGVSYGKVVRLPINYNTETSEVVVEKFVLRLSNAQGVKKIRYKVVNRGTNPKTHPFAGEKSWVFLDEITFE